MAIWSVVVLAVGAGAMEVVDLNLLGDKLRDRGVYREERRSEHVFECEKELEPDSKHCPGTYAAAEYGSVRVSCP